MAVTFAGQGRMSLTGTNTLSGTEQGTPSFGHSVNTAYSVGAAAPNVDAGGGYEGTFTCPTTGALLNLADSTNILKTGAVGDAIKPFQGYIVTGVKKLKALILANTSTTATVRVSIPAAGGLAGLDWVANGHVVTLQPNSGAVKFDFPAGSSVLTAGSNDGLTFTASAGTPTVVIVAFFG